MWKTVKNKKSKRPEFSRKAEKTLLRRKSPTQREGRGGEKNWEL